MRRKPLLQQINTRYPIFQAPMAGVTTPEFVAKVSQYGGLGNIGAGYLSPKDTEEHIKSVKSLTSESFGVNLFVPENNEVTEKQLSRSFELIKRHLNKLDVQVDERPDYKSTSVFDEQIEIVLAEAVPICSFTFGIPDEVIIRELKNRNIFSIGTATTVKEAQLVEEAGMDAVVVQGSEAGGHRGTFHGTESYVGIMALTPQVVDSVSIPVIAAGGIMDGRGLTAALGLGAEAAQFGTAFLTTKECGTNPTHKSVLFEATEEETVLTTAFSGKTARGIKNDFINKMKQYESQLPPFPYQNTLTKEMRQVAGKQQNKQYMSLWSGQAPRLTQDLTVKQLINQIMSDYENIRKQFVRYE